ncbi:unnamed protein product [Hermetia illucens]|uniref:Uncharacterized protein n=1 Tax=Hermetia illucens TaxID=343691 RepID=A0A7R8UQP9_HERIL|nr:unnamed protein product [Hermetia illucens]
MPLNGKRLEDVMKFIKLPKERGEISASFSSFNSVPEKGLPKSLASLRYQMSQSQRLRDDDILEILEEEQDHFSTEESASEDEIGKNVDDVQRKDEGKLCYGRGTFAWISSHGGTSHS